MSGDATLRRIHIGLIDAVLAGDGVGRVAALTARHLAGTVAIVLPADDLAAIEPADAARLPILRHYVADRLLGRPAEVPAGVVSEVAVRSGDERLGSVILLDAEPGPAAREILELAALAAITAVTLEQGASVTQRRARAGLLADLRDAAPPPAAELFARAKRLGCDLSQGASALCVRPATGDGERVLALIAEDFPRALAAPRGELVDALLPAPAGAARRLARRLARRAPTGLAPFEPDPAALPGALRAAELAMVLAEHDGVELDEMLGGSRRLLLGVAARDMPALDALVATTVGPVLAAGPLLETLRAFLRHGVNINATAAAIFAHRHTVAARLDRIGELTGHDPRTPHGQAQLALGLQALEVRSAAASGEHASAVLPVAEHV